MTSVFLVASDVSRTSTTETSDEIDGFIFGTEKDFERERLIEEMKSATAERITMKIDENLACEEEINVDDI